MSRRGEMLEASLAAFAKRGFEGTSIADLAADTGLSKAAFSYHFAGKDEILVELAVPLIEDLEGVTAGQVAVEGTDELRSLLERYVDALLRHQEVVAWLDGDKAALNHPEIGRRLTQTNRAMRRLVTGGAAGRSARIRGAAALGAMWRPIRNLSDIDVTVHRDEIVTMVLDGLQR